MFNCFLLQQGYIKITKWIGIIIFLGLLGACSKAFLVSGTSPAKNVDFKITSVEVRSFSSNQGSYGNKMAELVRNNITREGYIRVVDKNGQAVLTGTITIGRIDKKAHYTKSDYKDKNGKKIVNYYHNYRKQLTTQATYSLKYGNRQSAGNNFTNNYNREWSGSTAAEAKAKADSDDKIIISTLNSLAKQVMTAISPHKTNQSFKIPCSNLVDKVWCWNRPKTTKLGAMYYEHSRYDQAEKYWQKTIENEHDPKYQAEAHYLIGILRVQDNRLEESFLEFSKADELDPGNELYMSALNAPEIVKTNKHKIVGIYGAKLTESYRSGQSKLAYHLTVNAIPSNSRIRILNIKPKYKSGIKLKPGEYKIEVTRRGYKKKIKLLDITNDDLIVNIELQKK